MFNTCIFHSHQENSAFFQTILHFEYKYVQRCNDRDSITFVLAKITWPILFKIVWPTPVSSKADISTESPVSWIWVQYLCEWGIEAA